jgi:kumamolisin
MTNDAGSVAIPGSERAMPADAFETGAADAHERIAVTIVLRSRADAAASAAATGHVLADRRYLTREELAAARGAHPDDVLAVERFALGASLIVTSADLARRSVVVEGTVAQCAAAFGTDLRNVRVAETTHRMRTGSLYGPAALGGVITGVFGLDTRPQARAQFRIAYPHAATTAFTPLQLASLYAFPPNADGTGQTIALIELGGGYKPADLSAYFASLGIAAPTVVAVGVDGAANTPTGNANSADGEVELDIEVSGAIAPGAKIVVYFAPNTDRGFLDAITTAIHDTTYRPGIISISWGSAESVWTQQALTNFDAAFADAALAGITVCVAAGDDGSADGVTDGNAHVDFPASSPHVLACGGTSLRANGTTIAAETVWNDAGGGATGGGVSAVFPLPSWQANAHVPPSANAGGSTGRGVPDVAGNADPATGYETRIDGTDIVLGGTSAVAPLWAALVARLNQLAPKPLGFLNPLLYANPAALHDITAGSNGAYTAGAGWDPCTGLGSPDGARLAQTLLPHG